MKPAKAAPGQKLLPFQCLFAFGKNDGERVGGEELLGKLLASDKETTRTAINDRDVVGAKGTGKSDGERAEQSSKPQKFGVRKN